MVEKLVENEQTPHSDQRVVDWSFFDERFGSDDDLVNELIAIYIEEAPKQMEQIRQAVQTSDAAGLSLYAHSMKGASANMGAMEVRYIAGDLEAKGKAGDFSGVAELFAALEKAYARVVDEFTNKTTRI